MPTDTRHPYRPAAVRAFTLIEILVVVGILGLLIALTVIGFRVVGGMGKSRVTEVALANCAGLLNTFKLTNSAANLLDETTVDAIVDATRWEISPNGGANSAEDCIAITPGMTSAGTKSSDSDRAKKVRFLRDETARVMRRLMSIPDNRKSVESMSPERLAKIQLPLPSPIATLKTINPSGDPAEYAVGTASLVDGINLLDGNGYPIYFIPGGGLRGVNLGYRGTGDKADPTNYDRANQPIRAPDRGPFWASPGPDGDLTTGDDNVYSFGEVTASK